MTIEELIEELKKRNVIEGYVMGNIVLYDDGSGRYTSDSLSKKMVFEFNSPDDLVKKLK